MHGLSLTRSSPHLVVRTLADALIADHTRIDGVALAGVLTAIAWLHG